MDRRSFLGVCAMAVVATACRGDDDDDAGAAGATTATGAPGDAVADEATGAALRVGGADVGVGQLIRVAFPWAAPGTLVCAGGTAAVADWPELAALLGTTFGGDGTTTFGLPTIAGGDGLQWLICGWGRAFADGQPGMIGEVRPMVLPPPTGSRLDADWLPCDGRRLPIRGNEALYLLMGTTFGGDGKVDFALPDLPPLGNMAWRIARAGHFPETTCDAVTPAVPTTEPLDSFIGSIVHLPYTEEMASRTCGVALCRGQLLQVRQWPELASVLGNSFGGDGRQDTFALPTIAGDRGITPAIVVSGAFPNRS